MNRAIRCAWLSSSCAVWCAALAVHASTAAADSTKALTCDGSPARPLVVAGPAPVTTGDGCTPLARARPATEQFAAAAAVDEEAPRGAVSGLRSPARGPLELAVSATDGGAGLAVASATVDGQPAGQVRLGPEGCGPPPAGVSCPATVSAVALTVDVAPFAIGAHTLQVRVADAAGNEALILDERIEVAGPPPTYTPSVTLGIGDGGSGSNVGPGGLAPGQRPTPPCLAPRLSMTLDERPLRMTKRGLPVLRAGRRYRFRGRLTCAVDDGRRSAPRGIPITLISELGPGGNSTLSKTGLATRRSGRVTLIMSYRSSRTLLFRYESADASTTRVRIAIVVARAASKAPR